MRPAWFVVLFCVCYAVASWLISFDALGQPVEQAWVLAALQRTPVPSTERVASRLERRPHDLVAISEEIAALARSREEAALLVAIGERESHYDSEVIGNRCKPLACDRGLARGAFQTHRLSYLADLWDLSPDDPKTQVQMAYAVLRRSLGRCKPFAPYPAHVFRAYRGGSCSWELRDEPARVAAYYRALR